MKNEVWKDIIGYEGRYQISNLGNIKSLPMKYSPKENILKQRVDHKGYLYVGLYDNNKKLKFMKVHRLVAEAFINNPNNLLMINHKDENKLNNNANNLEWCDNKYNINYGSHNIRMSLSKIKYKIAQLDENKNIIRVWNNVNQLCDELGYKKTTIWKSCQKHLKNYGYYWEYEQL